MSLCCERSDEVVDALTYWQPWPGVGSAPAPTRTTAPAPTAARKASPRVAAGEVPAAEHVTDAASVLSVPRHGSPKKAVEAGTEQLARPTHSAAMAALELAALQAPADQPAAHEPAGVPKLAKATAAMEAPPAQPSSSELPSAAEPHCTAGGGGVGTQATSPSEVQGPSGCGAVCTMAPEPW